MAGLTRCARPDFAFQLVEKPQHDRQHSSAGRRQLVFTASTGTAAGIGLTLQPAVAFHALQDGIQGARTDRVPVMAQFFQHPLPHDRMFRRVMQDVYFPEAQQDFPVKRLARWSRG